MADQDLIKQGLAGLFKPQVEFEKEYKSRASILFDFGIILKTFKIVITRFGVKH